MTMSSTSHSSAYSEAKALLNLRNQQGGSSLLSTQGLGSQMSGGDGYQDFLLTPKIAGTGTFILRRELPVTPMDTTPFEERLESEQTRLVKHTYDAMEAVCEALIPGESVELMDAVVDTTEVYRNRYGYKKLEYPQPATKRSLEGEGDLVQIADKVAGVGAVWLKKDKHARKRRSEFLRLARSQRARVVKLAYEAIQAVGETFAPGDRLGLLDRVFDFHLHVRHRPKKQKTTSSTASRSVHDGLGDYDAASQSSLGRKSAGSRIVEHDSKLSASGLQVPSSSSSKRQRVSKANNDHHPVPVSAAPDTSLDLALNSATAPLTPCSPDQFLFSSIGSDFPSMLMASWGCTPHHVPTPNGAAATSYNNPQTAFGGLGFSTPNSAFASQLLSMPWGGFSPMSATQAVTGHMTGGGGYVGQQEAVRPPLLRLAAAAAAGNHFGMDPSQHNQNILHTGAYFPLAPLAGVDLSQPYRTHNMGTSPLSQSYSSLGAMSGLNASQPPTDQTHEQLAGASAMLSGVGGADGASEVNHNSTGTEELGSMLNGEVDTQRVADILKGLSRDIAAKITTAGDEAGVEQQPV